MAEIKIKERQKELTVRVSAALVVVVLGFLFVVNPFFKKSYELKRQINQSAEKVELYGEVEAARAKLAKLEDFFTPERSEVLRKISDVANKEKLEVEALTPKTEPSENYLKLLADVSVRGSFFSIVKFLKNVDSFNPAIKINSVIIKRPQTEYQNEKTAGLKAVILLESYLKQKVRKSRGQ